MAYYQESDLTELLIVLSGKLIAEGRFEAAMSLSLLSHHLAIDMENEDLKSMARTWLSMAFEGWNEETKDVSAVRASETPSCSFCGRREPEVRLAAGAKAFICDSCVKLLTGVFAKAKEHDV
jgi:hypothetical protein